MIPMNAYSPNHWAAREFRPPQHTLFFLTMIQFLSKDKTEFPAIVSSESGPLQSTVT